MIAAEIIAKYLPEAISPIDPSLSQEQHFAICNNLSLLNKRKDTPFKSLAKEICKASRKDTLSRMILVTFIQFYSSDCTVDLDIENLECFKNFYLDNMKPEDIAIRHNFSDRRTVFKKIGRVNTVFALFLYDICRLLNS